MQKRSALKKLLSLLLVLATVFSLAACANGGTNGDGETSAQSGSPDPGTEAEEPETEKLYPDNLPETMDWGGYEVRFLSAEEKQSIELDDEDKTGDVIIDAYWRRNEALTSRLNISVILGEKTGYGNFSATANQSVTAGSDDYDIFCGHTRFNIALASAGRMLKLNETGFTDTVDVTAPYWSQLYISNVNYKDNLYWLAGDMTHNFIGYIYAMFVNAKIWTDFYSGESIYDTVLEGKWTLDEMSGRAEGVYQDLNSNAAVDEADMFGVVMQQGHVLNGMVFGCGIRYTGTDDEGNYAVVLNNEHTIDVFNKLHSIFYETNWGYMFGNSEFDSGCITMFVGDRLLFCPNTFGLAGNEKLRDMESDYMIIPLPKYDENQENYRVNQYDGVPIYGCPTTLPKEKHPMIAAVLEADCSMTSKIVIPAYYDLALKNKYSRDATTAQMIDLIHDCITADFCFYWGDSVNGLMDIFYGNIQNSDFASVLKSKEKAWAKTLSKLVAKLEG